MPSQGTINRHLELVTELKNFVTGELNPTLQRAMKFADCRSNGNFDPDNISSEIDADDSLNHAASSDYNKAIDAINEFWKDGRIQAIIRS